MFINSWIYRDFESFLLFIKTYLFTFPFSRILWTNESGFINLQNLLKINAILAQSISLWILFLTN